MPLEHEPLESIEESDLQALVENQVAESKTIEYKQFLPGNSDSDKSEFLADVSSFANAAGGYLIFSITEEKGIPLEVCGLPISDPDAEIFRLDNIIRDCIEPRIPGVSIEPVPLQKSGFAIIIRIPKSWALPHMVKYKGHTRFYSRNSAGKYQFDVQELQALFALSETASERIRNFRTERLAKIIADETPVALEKGAKTILHIIPLRAFDPAVSFDLSSLADIQIWHKLAPISGSVTDHRFNFDGFLTFCRPGDLVRSYVQVFRNGTVEAVDAHLLRRHGDSRPTIPSVSFEERLLEVLPRLLSLQKELTVEPPFVVMVSILAVRGYVIGVNSWRFPFADEVYPIDRDVLLIPEIMLEDFEVNTAEVMRPIFDAIWNAAGWPRSMNYDNQGKWHGR